MTNTNDPADLVSQYSCEIVDTLEKKLKGHPESVALMISITTAIAVRVITAYALAGEVRPDKLIETMTMILTKSCYELYDQVTQGKANPH